MKIRTFFIASLLFPYFLWVIVKAISINTAPMSLQNNSILKLIMGIFNFIFMSGIWGWVLPYTILVIGLIKWSKSKPQQEIRKVGLYAPFLLSLLVGIEIMVVFLLLSVLDGIESFFGSVAGVFLIAPLIYGYAAIVVVPLGYIFVCFSLAVLKLLTRLRVIKVDEESSSGNENYNLPA